MQYSPDSADVGLPWLARMADALADKGLCVIDHALPPELADALLAESRTNENVRYRAAGIGRDESKQTDTEVRSDDIEWLSGSTAVELAYMQLMETLRRTLNRELMLGLFDYECMFARYPAGARYSKHLDAFTGNRNRVLSTVLYLNRDWQVHDAGELVLYARDSETELARIHPEHNRLVLFLSEQFPHEVLPTRRARYSLTGWFRVNSAEGWKRPV